MTRGRTVWLALLALGLAVGLLLRTGRRESVPDATLNPPSASSLHLASDEAKEFEIELSDPTEVGVSPRAAPASSGNATSEEEVVRELAQAWRAEPERALVLAGEAEKRFGESPRAVERRLYEIKALVKLGRIGNARSKAERYLADYPPGPMTEEVERLTGVHRRPEPEPAR